MVFILGFYITFTWFHSHDFLCVANVVSCPLGSYQNYALNKCIPCPKGTYQDIEGQTQCKSCPPLTSTIKDVGAKSISDCKGTLAFTN